MLKRKDREWMYNMADDDGYLSKTYRTKVDSFLDYAFSNEEFVDKDCIKCPCAKCDNRPFKTRNDVKYHLLKEGFTPDYTSWWAHGETASRFQHEGQPPNPMEDDHVDGCTQMVMDAMGPTIFDTASFEPTPNSNSSNEQPPNPSAKGFYDMLAAADEPLWDGCQNYSKLQIVSELLNWKSENNVSEAAYNRLIPIIKKSLPPSEKLVKNFYETKKSLKKLALPEQKIHACKNHCMLFYGKKDSTLTHCRVCGHSRYKSGRLGLVPHLVLRYLPIAPRLQRLYMSKKTAKDMTWHFDHQTQPGAMVHPSDGKAWKHFDSIDPQFASEIRNVRLGLCTDGFSPHNSNSKSYSCWPVFLTIYNLPPWMGLKESYVELSMLIPGKKSPGQNIDVFLRPLVDELITLYNDGIETYDAARKENFIMKVVLLWTVSDFPAYAMLSGWSTHGKLACPYCMGDSGSFQLEHGGKPCWFDCHRKFLPSTHPYRNDKRGFIAGKVVLDGPPLELTGDQIWEQIRHYPTVYEGNPYRKTNQKLPGFGRTHNWVKRSIFWELPYWRTLLIRHNLDVMHIEKNVFENLFNTVMGTSKTKDNVKARKDVKKYCKRAELHIRHVGTKDMKPKASYTLTKPQVSKICEWLTHLKFPDGYASNLGGCVSLEDQTFYSFKSHECHVFMQRLLPIALRGMIPNSIWDVITELSTFFRVICARVLHTSDLILLQQGVVETICKLEKIFPPGFFDSMEHLVIHLTREAILGGPVQYRWMYLYERRLGSMKRKIRNQAKVEGSMVESYRIEELSTFCSQYFEPTIETRLTRDFRNFAPDVPCFTRTDSRLSIFKVPCRRLYEKSGRRRSLSDEEMRMAHNYIILNCEELHPYIGLFDDSVRHTQPQLDEKGLESYRDKHFVEWLEQHVCESSDDSLSHLKGLARGPLRHAWSHKGYFINGFKFHTEKYGEGRVTHNSGVCVKGACYNETECDFYGLLEEVIEVAYRGVGRCVVILFKCKWFDAARGVRIDNKHNLVDIRYKSRLINDEPFVLASQVEQVYYAPYPSMTKDLKDWWVVVKTKPRSIYELEECENEEDDDDNRDGEEFFQESETLIPTTSRSSSEIEEPVCLVIQGELEIVNDNGDETHTEVSDTAEQSDEAEFSGNSDESDDDCDDIYDDSSDNE